ncbi:MAG: AbrB/MazE/SpoVT family DNA-binding domain-containing protein [Clostridium sp.]|nr:AbrB/MazE/SpoVT family DNA-binding domain-containing protein [Clostridium sp.]MCI7591086.1 AbrB/MazE/SpoVT family DNA-binding domain-containing protein [Lactobacillus johnsonii]MDY4184052.1 AbrB/MazE/SpoVT family DNA-binding domain-containing protein [Candidatus Onthovivens sp.]
MFELRQIDELGRVAIPKEIREQINIKTGALMIIIDEGKNFVTFAKYDSNVIPPHDTTPSDILREAISEMAVYAAESEYETEFYEIMDEVAKLMNECEEIENRG